MISFREIAADDAEIILTWRTSERVTKFLNTDLVYDIEAQKRWLSNCYKTPHYYHWIVLFDDIPIGVVNLCDISIPHAKTSWGFYIGLDNFTGYGAFIPPYVYNFVFGQLHLKKIEIEVFFNNFNVIALHQFHGYKFTPEFDRIIYKNGKEILLISMCLDQENWNLKRFGKFQAKFPTTQWKGRKGCP